MLCLFVPRAAQPPELMQLRKQLLILPVGVYLPAVPAQSSHVRMMGA